MTLSFFIFSLSVFVVFCPRAISDVIDMTGFLNAITPYCGFIFISILLFWIVKPLALYFDKRKQATLKAKERLEQQRLKEEETQKISSAFMQAPDFIKEKISTAFSQSKLEIEFNYKNDFPSLGLSLLEKNGVIIVASINIIHHTKKYKITEQAIPVIKKLLSETVLKIEA